MNIPQPDQRILLVEDEVQLAELMGDYLRAAHYRVEHLASGDGVIEAVRNRPPALILLDLMLPGVDGITLCTEIRRFSDVPIIMTTARTDEIDRLLGLEIGADDYVCKPYKPREVVARVKAILRRIPAQSESLDQAKLLLNEERFVAVYQGSEKELTPIEFRMLRLLVQTPGRVFSRNQLFEAAYVDGRIVSDRTIDSHVKNLRNKLSDIAGDTQMIRSVYGVGYKLEWQT